MTINNKSGILYANNLIFGISSRMDGTVKKNSELVFENIKKILEKHSINPLDSVFMNQVHRGNVSYVSSGKLKLIDETDGLISDKKNVCLCVVTADCVPLIFFEPKKGIIGVAHAGYKGILSGIVKKMIKKIKLRKGNVKNLLVIIGPSIGRCCYDVSKDRINSISRLMKNGKSISNERKGKFFLDLKETCKEILIEQGVLDKNIESSPICTKCSLPNYYSYRGDTKESFGEFMSFIEIK